MTAGRELPVVLVALVLVLGATFTFSVNRMLGGTVVTAPPREIPQSPAVSSENATSKPAAGSPSKARKKATPRRRAVSRNSRKRSTAAATVTAPQASAPAPASVTAPPPSPAPSTSQPAPAPKPEQSPSPAPKRKSSSGSGGGSFYNTG